MLHERALLTATLLTGLFLLTSCGAEPPDSTPPHFGQPEAASTQDANVHAGDAATEGTLQLGDTTYEFAVRACDFSGDADDMYQTVSGRGTTPAGEPFDVFVSRNDVGGIMMHTVSFQTGNVRGGEGTVFEASRMRSGGAWTSMHGASTDPLIQIDGNRLTASGVFGNDETGETREGRIEATCDQ